MAQELVSRAPQNNKRARQNHLPATAPNSSPGSTGNVEATTSYDAYGNTTGATGTTTTPFGYDAQDTNTGLIYQRAASLGFGGIAAASGLEASTLDGATCLNGDTGACIGAGLGVVGTGLGGPEFLAARGLIGEGSVFRGLATGGLLFGFSGALADIINHPNLLSPLLGC